MMDRSICFFLVWAVLTSSQGLLIISAQEASTAKSTDTTSDFLNEHLEPFRHLLGKTFRSEFANSTPEKPVIDLSRFERAMNGQAIRNLHSINDGEYGGETIIMWDPKQQKVAYWYFTTAGFFTQGTFDFDGNTWMSLEEVTGNANGITQVRATSKLKDDGTLEIKSEYEQKGEWVPGRSSIYKPVENAEVKFK